MTAAYHVCPEWAKKKKKGTAPGVVEVSGETIGFKDVEIAMNDGSKDGSKNGEVNKDFQPLKLDDGTSSHHSKGHSEAGSHRSEIRSQGSHGHHAPTEPIYDLNEKEKIAAGVVGGLAMLVVIIMCVWSSGGLMAEHDMVHAITTNSRPGHMHGTLYSTPIEINLHGTETSFFEVRLIAMSTKNFAAHGDHRRLSPKSIFPMVTSQRVRNNLLESAAADARRLQSHGPTFAPVAGGTMAPSTTAAHSGHRTTTQPQVFTTSTHGEHHTTNHGAHAATTPHSGHATTTHAPGHHGSTHPPTGPGATGHGTGHGDAHGAAHGDAHGNMTQSHGNATGHGDAHGAGAAHGGAHGAAHGGAHGAAHGDAHGAGHGHGHHGPITGNLTYTLLVDGKEFFTKTINLKDDREFEEFEPVNVADLGADGGEEYIMKVTSYRSDGQETAFAAQVVRMGGSGAYREVIGAVIFVVCFVGIISEKIHRVYSAMLGSAAALCAVSAIQETLHLHSVTGMIDFGTLMLLFSMMILMKMLQETGFFNWFAIKVVKASKQNPKLLFFAMTNICGFLSMFLDNVTCVLLFGPLTYSLCKQMSLNPRPLYLSMAICATVGGTGTLIGDPPNIVIGSKMKVGFETFLAYNFPIVGFACLPVGSSFLYWRFKDKLTKGERVMLDLDAIEKENRITDMPKFSKLAGILVAVFFALMLAPVHKIEPAWFTVMAMFAGAILFEPHHIHHYLTAVEWDTLFFFAMLFVLVESLSELGVIKLLGTTVVNIIMSFPEAARMPLGLIVILWISAFGSAFLESLPFTTTIVYILLDMRQRDTPGVDAEVLIWPLSVGACIGGIGSIMGSSANLVSMAVSGRQAECEEDKIQGSDFLKYGLPTMVILIAICMVWQLLLFIAIGAPGNR
eukprot:TRINITY_DN10833_c0_g1_i1.p1 TRINITY_DN10833_c0_g1~~TRINITY_DN10833_c0_g1_i1.p1  ORF type:complete len:900 (+),score=190.60 TRINITY_DN10833_c0_g1_i1:163-2862(+)